MSGESKEAGPFCGSEDMPLYPLPGKLGEKHVLKPVHSDLVHLAFFPPPKISSRQSEHDFFFFFFFFNPAQKQSLYTQNMNLASAEIRESAEKSHPGLYNYIHQSI